MTTLEMIAEHPFLDGLAPDELDRLARSARAVEFPAGTRVFGEGEHADRFWLLRDGHVQLDALVPGRGLVVIESLGAGAVLGWSWLFAPYEWHFGATAVEATRTVEFDGGGVRALCDDDPALGYALTRRFAKVVIDRLQGTRIRLMDLYRLP